MKPETPEHTILIVDDEQEILDSLRRNLRGRGYAIETTTSPREALALLERGDIDLLISDIDMPEMSGIELVAAVRAAHPDVVRMLLTGDASLKSAMAAINSGEVFRYLTKPWNKQELRETIGEALERIDELRRAATADRTASLRRRLLAELAAEHADICEVSLDDGVYLLDAKRLAQLSATIDNEELRAFFEPRPTRIETEENSKPPTEPGVQP